MFSFSKKNSFLMIIIGFAFSFLVSSCTSTPTSNFSYEPKVKKLSIDEREISIWHWQSKGESKGVILFSHGAASAPWKYDRLIKPWVLQGYDVYAPLHVDSTDHPQHEQYKGLASWSTRLQDMQLLSDTYGSHGYIAAGHSYGALTALVKGGAEALVPPGIKTPTEDSRVSLVLAFSPPPAIPGFIEKKGYANLSVPALIQTGTKDIPMGGTLDWSAHLDAYDMAATSGNRYALILENVDHYFGGAICRPELDSPKQLIELTKASDISLLFLEAYAHNDQTAKQKLTSYLTDEGSLILRKK